MKIKIITPFQFDDLYENSKSFYKDLEFEKIGIDGRNGFYEFAFFDYIMKDDKLIRMLERLTIPEVEHIIYGKKFNL